VNSILAPRRPGGVQSVDHCGGVSVWDVASGGRMGGVTGEVMQGPATTALADKSELLAAVPTPGA
jgi:hypothetical protein